jgi:hypothetical protein
MTKKRCWDDDNTLIDVESALTFVYDPLERYMVAGENILIYSLAFLVAYGITLTLFSVPLAPYFAQKTKHYKMGMRLGLVCSAVLTNAVYLLLSKGWLLMSAGVLVIGISILLFLFVMARKLDKEARVSIN